jgi:hypothetical protein
MVPVLGAKVQADGAFLPRRFTPSRADRRRRSARDRLRSGPLRGGRTSGAWTRRFVRAAPTRSGSDLTSIDGIGDGSGPFVAPDSTGRTTEKGLASVRVPLLARYVVRLGDRATIETLTVDLITGVHPAPSPALSSHVEKDEWGRTKGSKRSRGPFQRAPGCLCRAARGVKRCFLIESQPSYWFRSTRCAQSAVDAG